MLKLSNVKNKLLLNCLKEKYRYHLGEFSNMFVMFGADKV